MKQQLLNRPLWHALFLVIAILLYTGGLYAQNRPYSIKGVVRDARTNEFIPGATVRINNTTAGTVTNNQGAYQLTVQLSPGRYTITFSSLGFSPTVQNLQLGEQLEITADAKIGEDLVRLNEVVVTGTAVATSRRTLGNAISTVNAGDIANSAATSVDQALSGKISGAQITQNSGNPAGGISVRLRGTSTVAGAGDPLYIVDGVIINNSSAELLDLGGYSQNRLVDINPNDIERMEIIKGAAAAAIYGSRASNGVVQIFTKRGREGKPAFTVSTQLRVSDLRKKLEVNKYGFRFNNFLADDLTQTPVTRYDLQDDIFRTALGTDNNISVSGGSAGTQYYMSGNFLRNNGIIDQSAFTRGGGRVRVDQKLSDWLKMSLGANYILSNSKEIPNGGLVEAYGALTGFIFSNNYINPYPDPVTGVYPPLSAAIARTNPLEAINRFDFKQRTSRFIGDFQLNANPIKGLNINYIFGYDNSTQIGTGYIPVGNTTPSYNTGFSRRADRTTYLLNNDLNASYQTKINDWLESTSGFGATAQSEKVYQTAITATLLGPIGQTINNGVAVPTELRSDINIMGAYAQQTFGILNKIYLTGAARYDVSSVFGEEFRGQFYPKVSGSYVLSSEPFWKDAKISSIISTIKLRASYGQAGNLTAISAYDKTTSYVPVNVAGLPGVYSPTLLGNSEIKPERQQEFEVGTDMSFFSDRLSLEFSYYKKDVKDLIILANLTPSTGYVSQFINVGTMTNKGIELLLRGVPILRDNLRWNITATYSRNRNQVNDIPGGLLTFAGGFGQVAAVNGQPLGTFYSTYFARNADGSLLLTPTGLPQTEKVGRDANGQPVGATLRRVIGDPNPDWIGSLINEVTVGKHLTFRVQFDASIGGDVFNFTKRVGDRDLYGGLVGYEPELRGEVPKGTSAALFSIFENWIEDGSYVKLREISATYDYKPAFLKSGSIRFSLAGRNLLSFDDYSGYDPEINAAGQSSAVRGFDFVEVPIPRMIVAGLSLTF
ncbi:SusC/RagA family TonB-linked outer membrane protein [Pedobacter sp.]|uniref:SusC/RagA family TonB-linked outer membrane protein n=1 Tax=Pedobacter sp. TaxID=1411316 RepID=UPI003D7F41FB